MGTWRQKVYLVNVCCAKNNRTEVRVPLVASAARKSYICICIPAFECHLRISSDARLLYGHCFVWLGISHSGSISTHRHLLRVYRWHTNHRRLRLCYVEILYVWCWCVFSFRPGVCWCLVLDNALIRSANTNNTIWIPCRVIKREQ